MKPSPPELPLMPEDVQQILARGRGALEQRAHELVLPAGAEERVLARLIASGVPAAVPATIGAVAAGGAKLTGATVLAAAFATGLVCGGGASWLYGYMNREPVAPAPLMEVVPPPQPVEVTPVDVVEPEPIVSDPQPEPITKPRTPRQVAAPQPVRPRHKDAPLQQPPPVVREPPVIMEPLQPDPPKAVPSPPAEPSSVAHVQVVEEVKRDSPAERLLLESARSALAKRDGTSAMQALGRHQREFPNGALMEERDALTVLAWVALQKRVEAQQAAEQFKRRYPRSLLIPAVQKALETLPSQP